MIGALPASQLAPLDYRYALDAALATLGDDAPLLICRAAELLAEVRQRLPSAGAQDARAALWVEPQLDNWRADLATLAASLPPGAQLAIVASLPLARRLPERRGWQGRPLGIQFGGLRRLRAALPAAGFELVAHHGVHSALAIGLNALSARAERHGRPELADRLRFAARLRYRSSGRAAGLATVALIVARRGSRMALTSSPSPAAAGEGSRE